jgi:hypothetical protein
MDFMNQTSNLFEPPVAVPHTVYSQPAFKIAVGLLLAYFIRSLAFGAEGNAKVRVPIVGPKDSIRARWQFFRNASTLVNEGYAKVGNPIYDGLR